VGFVAPAIVLPFSNHWLPETADEVRVTFPPLQNEVGPPVITGTAGKGFTVTREAAETEEHPLAPVILTV